MWRGLSECASAIYPPLFLAPRLCSSIFFFTAPLDFGQELAGACRGFRIVRVGQALDVDDAGIGPDGRLDFIQIQRVHEAGLDAQAWEFLFQQSN